MRSPGQENSDDPEVVSPGALRAGAVLLGVGLFDHKKQDVLLCILLFIFERRFEQFDNEFPRTRAAAMCDWLKRIMGYAQSSHSDHL